VNNVGLSLVMQAKPNFIDALSCVVMEFGFFVFWGDLRENTQAY
jgi:hypothetical protein